MFHTMEKEKIKEIVYGNYAKGFHCAEAIVNTIHELFPDCSEYGCKTASGFCGGIGKCKQDICGALSGGVIALGAMFGRNEGDRDISKLVFLSAKFRRSFAEEFSSTVCKDVVENIANRPEYEACKDVTVKASLWLYDLIKDELK